MKRALLPLLALCLAQGLGAQTKGHIQIVDDVIAGTSMQIYMDFGPVSAIGGIPPLVTAAEDVLVVVEPVGSDLSSAGFGAVLAATMNDAFGLKPIDYKARFRAKDGDKFTHDAVTIISPVSLQGLYISPDSATHPNTLVTGAGAISFNPTFSDITRRIEQAWPGFTNATLLVNDVDPAVDPLHQVEVFAPGNLKFSFLSGTNTNQPIVFLLSDFYNPETIPQAFVPFPGSLDIGTHNGVSYQNVVAIADAITGSSGNPFLDQFFFTDQNGRLDFQISLGLNSAGDSIAAQAIIADPTQPVGLAFTQAADINAATGKEVVLPLLNDGGVQVLFEAGKSFDFYGQTYSAINVNENGFVTFSGPPPSGAATAQIDPATALASSPAIFVNWGDWDTATAGVRYREFGRELRISWGDPAAPLVRTGPGGAIASGDFTLTLHLDAPSGTAPPSQRFAGDGPGSIAASAGSIFLDIGNLLPLGGVAGLDAVAGISPGGIMSAVGVFNSSFSLPRYPQLPDRPNLIQHDRSDSAQSSLPVASGGNAVYRNGASLGRRIFGFFPVPVGPGTGYVAIVDRDQEPDLQGATVGQISVGTIGGQAFNLVMVGYFRHLYAKGAMAPMPLVELVNAATLLPVTPLQILSVMTPNGPADAGTLVGAPTTVFPAPGFRPFEGATVKVPAGAISPTLIGSLLQLRVTLPDGSQFLARDPILVMP